MGGRREGKGADGYTDMREQEICGMLIFNGYDKKTEDAQLSLGGFYVHVRSTLTRKNQPTNSGWETQKEQSGKREQLGWKVSLKATLGNPTRGVS